MEIATNVSSETQTSRLGRSFGIDFIQITEYGFHRCVQAVKIKPVEADLFRTGRKPIIV